MHDKSAAAECECSERDVCDCRLWYVACLGVDADHQQAAAASPVEVGCVNVIPKCNEWTGKHPVYENLPETYAAINNYLADSPLEGTRLRVNHSVRVTNRLRPVTSTRPLMSVLGPNQGRTKRRYEGFIPPRLPFIVPQRDRTASVTSSQPVTI